MLSQLNAKGLRPNPEADRRTLIRRLYYDLTGLPPSPQQVQEFINDNNPEAYERLIDRLLASPRYGEKWARHWLDIVKYADTCGYDKDKLRPNAWPYRDYVIRSLNEDKPYWKFVQEQVAGDVLFPGTQDGTVALGFIAAGPWDFIGHVEVPESKLDGQVARNLDRDDMVCNTLNTFCSVTIQCARCHHHKFDPFTQEHYYSLQAVFAAIDRADRFYDADQEVARSRTALTKQLQTKKKRLATLDAAIEKAGGAELAAMRSELDGVRQQAKEIRPVEFGYHSQIAETPDQQKWVEVRLAAPASIQQIVVRPCHDDFAGIGAGFGFPVRFLLEAEIAPAETGLEKAALDRDGSQPVWETVFDSSEVNFPNPGLDALSIDCDLQRVTRVRMTASRLAPRKGDFILALAEIQLWSSVGSDVQPVNIATQGTVTALDSIEAAPRWRKTNLVDEKWPAATRDGSDKIQQLEEEIAHYLKRVAPELLEEHSECQGVVRRIDAALDSLPAPGKVYAATTHFSPEGQFKPTNGQPRRIHVLHRGEVSQPTQHVGPGVLPLSPSDNWQLAAELDEARRRKALALWLTREDHPLVWRSLVNRVWQYHFGRGLVATPNDFGRMGARPTHPALLDWLATEFLAEGQSLKRLHRLLVTSSTYRQSSSFNQASFEIDSSNQYLWRMNRRRLEAEEIRDSILQASGALDLSMGGPGFYLFALERTEHSPHYEYHKFDPSDKASHRRSIYRFIVRSQPDPWMSTLDCADSSQSTPIRNETLTPLQALSMLNSPFSLEMADTLAARLEQALESESAQIEQAVRLVLQRSPNRIERELLEQYVRQHGLSALCRYLFNLNEFVFVD